jgi:hypothetical protein
VKALRRLEQVLDQLEVLGIKPSSYEELESILERAAPHERTTLKMPIAKLAKLKEKCS